MTASTSLAADRQRAIRRTSSTARSPLGRGPGDLWVFGYASLIWRPEFEFEEHRAAAVHGWHRGAAHAFAGEPRHARAPGPGVRAGARRLVPRRGLPHRPGACRIRAGPLVGARDAHWRVRPEMAAVPMPEGTVEALGFTLSRRSPNHTGDLAERRADRDPQDRERPLRQHAGIPGRDGALAADLRHPRSRRRAPSRPARAVTR